MTAVFPFKSSLKLYPLALALGKICITVFLWPYVPLISFFLPPPLLLVPQMPTPSITITPSVLLTLSRLTPAASAASSLFFLWSSKVPLERHSSFQRARHWHRSQLHSEYWPRPQRRGAGSGQQHGRSAVSDAPRLGRRRLSKGGDMQFGSDARIHSLVFFFHTGYGIVVPLTLHDSLLLLFGSARPPLL